VPLKIAALLLLALFFELCRSSRSRIAALFLSCAAQDGGTILAALFYELCRSSRSRIAAPLFELCRSKRGTILGLCRSRWGHYCCGTIF